MQPLCFQCCSGNSVAGLVDNTKHSNSCYESDKTRVAGMYKMKLVYQLQKFRNAEGTIFGSTCSISEYGMLKRRT